jgi:hypothetical protein
VNRRDVDTSIDREACQVSVDLCTEEEQQVFQEYLSCLESVPPCDATRGQQAVFGRLEACTNATMSNLRPCESRCPLLPFGVIVECD